MRRRHDPGCLRAARALAAPLVQGAAYVALARLSDAYRIGGIPVHTLWCPSGAVLGALLRSERRWWPALAAAALAGNLLADVPQGRPPWVALSFGGAFTPAA